VCAIEVARICTSQCANFVTDTSSFGRANTRRECHWVGIRRDLPVRAPSQKYRKTSPRLQTQELQDIVVTQIREAERVVACGHQPRVDNNRCCVGRYGECAELLQKEDWEVGLQGGGGTGWGKKERPRHTSCPVRAFDCRAGLHGDNDEGKEEHDKIRYL